MPVCGIQQQTLVGRTECIFMFNETVVIRNLTTPFQTYCGLDRILMPVTAPYGIINTINVKNALNVKRNDALDHSQISSVVRESFQVN